MKNKLTEQFQRAVEKVSQIERQKNYRLRKKELWLRRFLEGMDQVLSAKAPKVVNAK